MVDVFHRGGSAMGDVARSADRRQGFVWVRGVYVLVGDPGVDTDEADQLHGVCGFPDLAALTDRGSSDTGSELRRFIDYMSVSASWDRCCRSFVWSS
jgi:hypothetical protein